MFELLDILSDQSRLRILYMLENSPCMVNDLQELLGLSQANTSKHLKKMYKMGLVGKIRCKKNVCYYLNRDYIDQCELYAPILERFKKEEVAELDFVKFEQLFSKEEVEFKLTMLTEKLAKQ